MSNDATISMTLCFIGRYRNGWGRLLVSQMKGARNGGGGPARARRNDARDMRRRTFSRLSNAQVQLQARYHHCGEAASEKCLSAATFVRLPASDPKLAAEKSAGDPRIKGPLLVGMAAIEDRTPNLVIQIHLSSAP